MSLKVCHDFIQKYLEEILFAYFYFLKMKSCKMKKSVYKGLLFYLAV